METMPDQRLLMLFRLPKQRGKASPSNGHQSNERSRIPKLLIIGSEQPPAEPEQCGTACSDASRLNMLIQECGPAILQLGELGPAHPARKQLLADFTKARLGGDNALIEILEPLSPPG